MSTRIPRVRVRLSIGENDPAFRLLNEASEAQARAIALALLNVGALAATAVPGSTVTAQGLSNELVGGAHDR
jgi:hypothetical protein